MTNTSASVDSLTHSWGDYHLKNRKLSVFDTTLRDGIQSPQIKRYPTLAQKIRFLEICSELGIDAIEIGMPVSSDLNKHHTTALAKHAKQNKLPILLSCLSRTLPIDIETIAQVSQDAGIEITVNLLLGASKLRTLVEDWSLSKMITWVENCMKIARSYNLPLEFITEDTSRAEPETIKTLYTLAIDAGVKRIWITDTVGVATPNSVKNLTKFMHTEIIKGRDIGLDWHGHDDKALGVANSLAAIEAGADRIQGTALGIGERAGNTPLEPIILNLVLEGAGKYNLKKLEEYSTCTAEMVGIPIRENYPAVGKYVYSTAVGIHAAAMFKARKMQRKDLEGTVYSPFDPQMLGKEVQIFVGPLSGSANVEWHLYNLGLPVNHTIINKLLQIAKEENRFIEDEEIITIYKKFLSYDA